MTEPNAQELEVIGQIASRAVRLFAPNLKQLDTFMDVEYTHRDIPMDLDKFLAFDDGNFSHDISGIHNNFNRDTLKMDNCFLPRCARPAPVAEITTELTKHQASMIGFARATLQILEQHEEWDSDTPADIATAAHNAELAGTDEDGNFIVNA